MSIKHAKQLNANNIDTLWQGAIGKEIYQFLVAFKILEGGEYLSPVWTRSSGHLIFDVKMDFTRKEIWVKDGHCTPDP